MDNIEQQFSNGLQKLHINEQEAKIEKQLAFIRLLHKWNKAYNLTAVKDINQMVTKHLLDSLVILPYINGESLLDVGTGAGLPGVPLALCLPEKKFTLLDGNGKKTRFIKQAIIELGMDNIEVVNARVEKYIPDNKFDIITSRAFSTIADFISLTKHLLKDSGQYLAMKGIDPQEEISKIDPDFFCKEVVSLKVPGLEAERNLVQILVRKH